MADKIEVTVLRQKVFHDGSSMVVLKPGDDDAAVSPEFLRGLYDEGVIADPGEDVLLAALGPVGFTDGGDLRGPGDNTLSQPIGDFTSAQERNLARHSRQANNEVLELSELRERVRLLTEEVSARSANEEDLRKRLDASESERDLLSRQLSGAQARIDAMSTFDRDGDGQSGGSLPQDPPALTGKNKADLLAIAQAEGVTVEDGATNADIVKAIEAKRAETDEDADGEDDAPSA